MHEGRIADHVSDGSEGVARREKHLRRYQAHAEPVAGLEQPVPLGAVNRQIRPIVYFPPELLHFNDMCADGDRGSGSGMQIVGRREMVGMWMGIEDPFHGQAIGRYIIQDLVGAICGGRAGFLVEIQHGVDDRTAAGCRVGDHILRGAGSRVVERADQRFRRLLRHDPPPCCKSLFRFRHCYDAGPLIALQISSISIAAETAPGSGWPSERSPRRAARPIAATMSRVASAPCLAAAAIASAVSPAEAASAAGAHASNMVFWPGSALPRWAIPSRIAAIAARSSSRGMEARGPAALPARR